MLNWVKKWILKRRLIWSLQRNPSLAWNFALQFWKLSGIAYFGRTGPAAQLTVDAWLMHLFSPMYEEIRDCVYMSAKGDDPLLVAYSLAVMVSAGQAVPDDLVKKHRYDQSQFTIAQACFIRQISLSEFISKIEEIIL
jgi:hypothetical protein